MAVLLPATSGVPRPLAKFRREWREFDLDGGLEEGIGNSETRRPKAASHSSTERPSRDIVRRKKASRPETSICESATRNTTPTAGGGGGDGWKRGKVAPSGDVPG